MHILVNSDNQCPTLVIFWVIGGHAWILPKEVHRILTLARNYGSVGHIRGKVKAQQQSRRTNLSFSSAQRFARSSPGFGGDSRGARGRACEIEGHSDNELLRVWRAKRSSKSSVQGQAAAERT